MHTPILDSVLVRLHTGRFQRAGAMSATTNQAGHPLGFLGFSTEVNDGLHE
jgi:hypothetical protein